MIKPQEFNYKPVAVSQQAFDEHKKLYVNYCNKTNELLEKLKYSEPEKADKNYSSFRSQKKELAYNLNSVSLHEMYFRNMNDKEKNPHSIQSDSVFFQLIKKHFGSLDNWLKDFIATAKSARGWAMCGYEQRTGKLCNMLQDTYSEDLIVNTYPLIVLDVYEHAYFSDYKSNVNAYIEKFVNSICWDTVEERASMLKGV